MIWWNKRSSIKYAMRLLILLDCLDIVEARESRNRINTRAVMRNYTSSTGPR